LEEKVWQASFRKFKMQLGGQKLARLDTNALHAGYKSVNGGGLGTDIIKRNQPSRYVKYACLFSWIQQISGCLVKIFLYTWRVTPGTYACLFC
jgi:predicted permease